ncbi:MAG TPA: hemolysin III family protein [Egibacteraceae bacterium]|nr:hemolysin III family protein [Egibacteraceae bacterium]
MTGRQRISAATDAVAAGVEARPVLRGWLHASATPLALAGAWLLWRSAPAGGLQRLSVMVFGMTLVGLYSISSVYHLGSWRPSVREWLGRCDAAMIQLFIVGTFTPVAFFSLHGGWRAASLAVAWLVALVGAGIALSPLRAPRWLVAAGYVGVGWLSVVPFTRIITALPWEGSGLIALGGVLYTVGAVVYARRWPDPSPAWFGYHEIFHLFVIAGSTAHYLAIWRYVLPAA